MAEVDFSDICSPAQFAADYPHLVNGPGLPKMEYLVRTRHLNGLSKAGAIIEPVHDENE